MKKSCQWQDPHKEAKTLQYCPYNLLVIIYEGKIKQQKPHVQAAGSEPQGCRKMGQRYPVSFHSYKMGMPRTNWNPN